MRCLMRRQQVNSQNRANRSQADPLDFTRSKDFGHGAGFHPQPVDDAVAGNGVHAELLGRDGTRQPANQGLQYIAVAKVGLDMYLPD